MQSEIKGILKKQQQRMYDVEREGEGGMGEGGPALAFRRSPPLPPPGPPSPQHLYVTELRFQKRKSRQGLILSCVNIQIKADRGEVEAGKDTIAKMQKETAQAAEAKRK